MGLPYKNMYSYWLHYWRHCIEKLTDKDNVSFRILGPRMLIRDLVDELEGHGLSNQENISYFRSQLSVLDKKDVIFKTLCHPMVACLLQRLGDKTNRESSILLCRRILNTLVVKHYFTLLVDWLAKNINEAVKNDFDSRKKINDITHLVIAEFVAEGFVLEEIKKYATDIPNVAIAEGGVVMAAPEEYENLKESDFTSQEEYYEAVSDFIKNRDVFQCLDVLKYHYYADPQDAFFIVRLKGLKGQIDDHIGDINIYSPKVRRYITTEYSLSDIEKVTEGRDWVNAAVPIDFKSIEQAKVYAKAKLEEVLDILMLTYRTKTPITIATNIYAVVADGRELSMSISNKGNDPLMASRDEMMQYLDAFDLNEVKGDGFRFLSDKHQIMEFGQGVLKRRLKNSAHWYTKAVASDKEEDVLLYSWFAIEGLLKLNVQTQIEMLDNDKVTNSLKVIQEFVTAIICKSYFHTYLRDTYRRFFFLTSQYHNYYDIKDDVIKKAALDLKPGDHYRDGDFLNAIPDMMACVNDDIVKDELARLQEFYNDEKGIKDKVQQLKDDVLMIYRLRNMIVHNAALSCVNIGFYARETMFFAQRVIRYIIDKAGGNKTIEDIVLGAKLNYQIFLANYDDELRKLKGV